MEKKSNETVEEEVLTSDGNNNELPEDSDRSHSSSNEDNEMCVLLDWSEVREFVECPICLGIIQKTKAIKECLHRFCGECIEKSLRFCNSECPICRTHYAGQSSLKDDLNYDAIISYIYTRVDKYEEEELSFHEDDKKDNKP